MIEARAEIVGHVWQVLVREGDAVGSGDTLAVLETMKMEIPVVAAGAGHVSVIRVEPGQIVQEGDLLVEIDPTAGV